MRPAASKAKPTHNLANSSAAKLPRTLKPGPIMIFHPEGFLKAAPKPKSQE